MKKYQIFISSTYEDLKDERRKVRDAILEAMHFPVGMELFGAADETAWKVIERTIDDSDYYVLILGNRYGSETNEGISYTQKEYMYARSRGIPVLAFQIDEDAPTIRSKVETDPKKMEKLQEFKALVNKNHTTTRWKNADELCIKVINSLNKQIASIPRPGWVRGTIAGSEPEAKLERRGTTKGQELANPDLRVGSTIDFGEYPQGENGESMPLKWRGLKVEDGKALLITDRLIDCVKYHNKKGIITWHDCSLRKWLNASHGFMGIAFTQEEQSRIIKLHVQTPDNAKYHTEGGEPTDDKVFFLSIEEAYDYLYNDEERKAAPTPYAVKHGSDVSNIYTTENGEKTGWWWLRSPGIDCFTAACVNYSGDIYEIRNYEADTGGSVRPALWLNLKSEIF